MNNGLLFGILHGITATSALSAPIYYAFTGSALTTPSVAGFTSPYTLGQNVKFVIAVDRERVGEWVDEASGLVESIPGDAPGESFYAEWVAGNLAQTEPIHETPASYYLGLQWGSQSQLLTSNTKRVGFDMLEIINPSLNIDNWVVGTTGFTAGHWMYAGSIFAPVATFDLTLTHIQSDLPGGVIAAIPEPGTMALLGLSFLWVAYRTQRPLRQLGKSQLGKNRDRV